MAAAGPQVSDHVPCPVIVINLDRAPERLAQFSAAADAAGVAFQRLPAIDGRMLTGFDDCGITVDAATWQTQTRNCPTINEIACFLSHREAARAALTGGATSAVICEDDAVLTDRFADAIRVLNDCTFSGPTIVKLSAIHRRKTFTLDTVHGFELGRYTRKTAGAACYWLNTGGLQAIAGLETAAAPFDWVLDQWWRYGFQLYALTPETARVEDGETSTIGYSPGRSGASLASRLSRYLHRARIELERRKALRNFPYDLL